MRQPPVLPGKASKASRQRLSNGRVKLLWEPEREVGNIRDDEKLEDCDEKPRQDGSYHVEIALAKSSACHEEIEPERGRDIPHIGIDCADNAEMEFAHFGRPHKPQKKRRENQDIGEDVHKHAGDQHAQISEGQTPPNRVASWPPQARRYPP